MGCKLPENLYTIAACANHLEVVKWLWSVGITPSNSDLLIANRATLNGNLEMLAWIKGNKNFKMVGENLFRSAVSSGRMETIRWLQNNGFTIQKHTIMYTSCSSIEVLEYLLEIGCSPQAPVWYNCESLEVIKWAHKRGYQISNGSLFETAIRRSDFEVIKWARSVGIPWALETCDSAAILDFEIFKWIRENGGNWSEQACENASSRGRLDNLKYARENGCQWNKRTTYAACRENKIETFIWAFENGCKLDKALDFGSVEIAKWVKERGYRFKKESCRKAAKAGNEKVLEYLIESGCPWNKRKCWKCAKKSGATGYLKQLLQIEDGKPLSWS